jgi:hypothetical protein
LANDGVAAHEILIEGFEIEPGVWAAGSMISRIREKGDGFAFVSLRGIPGFAFYTEKWDLLRYMAAAAAKKPASQISQIEHRVKVRAIYRDGFNIWYRSQADLIYIPTQNRLTFGPTTQQRCGTHSGREALLKLAECPPDESRPAKGASGSIEADSLAPSDKFTSDLSRIAAVGAYTGFWQCSEAALARTARVDPADLSKWKKDLLPVESEKKGRIEQALKKNETPILLIKRSRNS